MKSFLILFLLHNVYTSFGQTAWKLDALTFQRHTELTWTEADDDIVYYRIMRSNDGQNFGVVKTITTRSYMDYSSPDGLDTFYYFVEALSGLNQVLSRSDTIKTAEYSMSDEALMDMVQLYTFRYFWDEAHPISGMARERNSSDNTVTCGGTGFGIMGLLVGIENDYITRSQGAERLLKILGFLQFADRFHGVFPHWMHGKTGKVIPFSNFDNGGDLVETAFLMQGLLAARSFFDQENDIENTIRQAITKLYNEVEWDFYTRNNSGVLYWHWSPNFGWQMNFPLRGYNEALVVYLLAIASPTHSIPPSYYHKGWAGLSSYKNGNTWFGHRLLVGPPFGGPLFFAHYSFLGFDPRGIKDMYANYFEQNKNHTLINRAYCIKNQLNHKGYGENVWGLTASDNPFGYLAHEPGSKDNGTIAPTAALSSMPYTPNESMQVLKHLYLKEGHRLFGPNGFYDAFNDNKNWVADSYLAIDQGPILVMIQNHRTALLWKMFMKNPEIGPALNKIGFVEDISALGNDDIKQIVSLYPNPTSTDVILHFSGQQLPNKIYLFDIQGKLIFTFDGQIDTVTTIPLEALQVDAGIYILNLVFSKGVEIQKMIFRQ